MKAIKKINEDVVKEVKQLLEKSITKQSELTIVGDMLIRQLKKIFSNP
jgi:hypothetical protein